MKDYRTKRILIRYDSTGDLYPITSPTPQAFVLVFLPLWHQRLGHSCHHVFKQLVDSHLIPCYSLKSSSPCHACQLGKHVKLHCSLSNFVSTFPFEIVHYDVWTSHINSVSAIKYYVIFLDNYYHFL